jgi:hypothetical protein
MVNFRTENLKESCRFGRISVDISVILKRIIEKQDVSLMTGLIWLRIETKT